MPDKRSRSLIGVVLVDDSEMIRQRLRAMIHRIEGTEVLGDAGSIAEGLSLTRELQPDFVILDLSLPNGSGLGLLEEIGGVPRPRVIVLTNYPYAALRNKAIELGAEFFLDKATGFDTLEQILREAACDE